MSGLCAIFWCLWDVLGTVFWYSFTLSVCGECFVSYFEWFLSMFRVCFVSVCGEFFGVFGVLWAFLHYVVSVLWAILSGFWVCFEWNFEWFCGVLSGLGAVLHCECFCVLWLVNVSHVTQLKQVIVCYDFWGKRAIVWWVCVYY